MVPASLVPLKIVEGCRESNDGVGEGVAKIGRNLFRSLEKMFAKIMTYEFLILTMVRNANIGLLPLLKT